MMSCYVNDVSTLQKLFKEPCHNNMCRFYALILMHKKLQYLIYAVGLMFKNIKELSTITLYGTKRYT